jgi:Leucine-rich repeat (LRR) protein
LRNPNRSGLVNVKFLSIHGNRFQYGGYPDTEIPCLSGLQNLSIDVFSRFHFNDNFTSLKKLSNVTLQITGSPFHLTNTTFHGLIQSPVHYLDMNFKLKAYCDISEDLFCSFPFVKGVYFSVERSCSFSSVLWSLKCLQNKSLDYLAIPSNIKAISADRVILNKWNSVYLFNICAKAVDISGNRIAGITADPWRTRFANCVEILDISFYHQLQINTGIVLHLISSYPKLRVLCLRASAHNPSIRFATKFLTSSKHLHFTYKLSPKLQYIDFSDNYIHTLRYNADFNVIGEALEEFYIPNTNFPCEHINPFQIPKLERIDISMNNCYRIRNDIFRMSNNLISIKASSTKINFIDFKSKYLFKNLSKLQMLDLSRNVITTLPKYLLTFQSRSLYTLNLDNNLLSSIPYTVSMLTNLSYLHVRYNRISFFQSSDIAILNQCKKVTIFIEGNPISCTCSELSSLKWMKENKIRIGDYRNTRCVHSNQTLPKFFHFETFRTFELNCQTKDWLMLSTVLLLVIIMMVIFLGAIKKYRVHVDYVILRLRHR